MARPSAMTPIALRIKGAKARYCGNAQFVASPIVKVIPKPDIASESVLRITKRPSNRIGVHRIRAVQMLRSWETQIDCFKASDTHRWFSLEKYQAQPGPQTTHTK